MGPGMLLERWTQVRLEGLGPTTHRLGLMLHHSLSKSIFKKTLVFIMLTKSVRDPTEKETNFYD